MLRDRSGRPLNIDRMREVHDARVIDQYLAELDEQETQAARERRTTSSPEETMHTITYNNRRVPVKWIIRDSGFRRDLGHYDDPVECARALDTASRDGSGIIRLDAVIDGQRTANAPHVAVTPVFDELDKIRRAA